MQQNALLFSFLVAVESTSRVLRASAGLNINQNTPQPRLNANDYARLNDPRVEGTKYRGSIYIEAHITM